jgi:hypothetical protein
MVEHEEHGHAQSRDGSGLLADAGVLVTAAIDAHESFVPSSFFGVIESTGVRSRATDRSTASGISVVSHRT